jgi:hypothetical protein
MRASDAERDEVVARLKEEFAMGRLSKDTFLFRVNEVLKSRHQADLPPLVADLPVLAEPGPSPAAAVQAFLFGRLRAAWPRRARPAPAAPAPAPSASSLVRRLTAGFPLADANARLPLPLQFPRSPGIFFSIGRDASCDLAISDMTVSRLHARLERTRDGWLLTDLTSTNGTRVNGWRVRGQVRVRAGDLVSFGDAQYSLLAADG